jgi:hypothetical protein
MRKVILFGAALVILGLLLALASGLASQRASISVTAYFNKGGDDLRGAIRQAISKHSGPIDIALYDLTDTDWKPETKTDLVDFIIDVAQTRPIRLLLSTEGGGGNTEKVICAGIDATPYGETYYMSNMHHKFLVIGDEAVITGSANWTSNSLDEEANDLVLIENREIAQAYKTEFERLVARAHKGCPS